MRLIVAFLLILLSWSVAAAQAFKPGDTLSISIFQDPKLDRTVLVGPTGMISFPLAGYLRAAGLTPQALEAALRSRLQKNYSDRLDITVALVSESRKDDDDKPRIFITGEIAKPGPYLLTRRTNIVQAIAQAGGLGPFAARHRIQVRRKINGEESIFTFNYDAFENGREFHGNIDLRGEDVIIVPERGLFN